LAYQSKLKNVKVIFHNESDRIFKLSTVHKLKVIEYTEKHGNRAAGHEFNVSEFNVQYWKKQKDALLNTTKSRKAFQGPKSGKFHELEDELLDCEMYV
jgi:hypothetical protein